MFINLTKPLPDFDKLGDAIDNLETLTCSRCDTTKPVGEFFPSVRDDNQPVCKPCHTEATKRWRKMEARYPKAMTITRTAKLLGISVDRVKRAAKRGDLEIVDFAHPKSTRRALRVTWGSYLRFKKELDHTAQPPAADAQGQDAITYDEFRSIVRAEVDAYMGERFAAQADG